MFSGAGRGWGAASALKKILSLRQLSLALFTN